MGFSPFIGLLDQGRDLEFAWHLGLAEAAAGDRYSIFGLFRRGDGFIAIFETFILVVALGRDGSCRAAGRAGLAGLVEIIEAV